MSSSIRTFLCGCFLLLSSSCGEEFVFFFHFAPGGVVGTSIAIVINEEDDDADEIVNGILISGEIPLGMELNDDGTLEGTPEEAGVYEFVVEWEYVDGSVEEEAYSIEISE